MLAVKVHHLRALIHRPFLCLPWLQRDNLALMDLLQRHRDQIDRAEKICVFEAQQTAHLLHNVDNERSLIHDFPLWQMISCLICASSILLIADAFLQDQRNSDFHPQDFRKDAENCLKVFEALSVNSEAARRARETLKAVTMSRRGSDSRRSPSIETSFANCRDRLLRKTNGNSIINNRNPNG